jgi:predicted outer membrane repeat protein
VGEGYASATCALACRALSPGEPPGDPRRDGLAVQIEPNPNPDGNTITITPSTPRENLVPFTNVGTINIEPLASFQNSNQFNNGILLPFTPGGAVINSGTIINSDQFNNYRRVSILEGSRFINLPSAFYYNGGGVTQINGIFINEGAAEHNSNGFAVSETGQYIQRQAVGSSVVPTTVNRDMVFRNAGQVSITAGEFINRPFGIYAQTGTTQIDAVFLNDGRVFNDGRITVGATGLYEHQSASPAPPSTQGSLTVNNGTFTNAGTTNINTGVFQNKGGFLSSGIVHIGEGATFTNTSGVYHPFPGGTTKIDGNFINNFAVQNGGAITVTTTGSFSQVAGLSPIGTGTGQGGTFTNAGRVYIGEGTEFRSGVLADRPTSSGQYVQLASGTTRIDGSFDTRGYVTNEGAMTVGATGQYLQSRGDSTGLPAVSTSNIRDLHQRWPGAYRRGDVVHQLTEARTWLTTLSSWRSLCSTERRHDADRWLVLQLWWSRDQRGGDHCRGNGHLWSDALWRRGRCDPHDRQQWQPLPMQETRSINAGTFTNHGSVVNNGTFQVAVNGVATLTNQGTHGQCRNDLKLELVSGRWRCRAAGVMCKMPRRRRRSSTGRLRTMSLCRQAH